jgi:hypothetical protein
MTVRTASAVSRIVAAAMVFAGPACGSRPDGGAKPRSAANRPEHTAMTAQAQAENGDKRLNEYMEISAKYRVVPVPTGLDRAAVIRFVNGRVTPVQSPPGMRKLLRLAAMYDARATAESFAAILGKPEREASDFARSAVSVAAVGWLGDEAQWRRAQRHYHDMLRRLRDDGLREAFLDAAFFLGPDEPTDELKRWAEQRHAALMAQAAKASRDEARRLELAADDLDEFIRLEIPRLDEADQVRERLRTLTDPGGRAARLLSLYLLEAKEATPRLSEWAAFALVRMADENDATRAPIAGECLKAARRYVKTAPADQAEFDLNRAKALRAAVFFGQRLTEEDTAWLAAQEDAGTDLLALRPDWKY